MTDIPKVITTLTDKRTNNTSVTSTSRTYTKSPESDRLVHYNTNGFIETSLPVIQGACNLVTDVSTAADVRKAAPYATILIGNYFSTSQNPVEPAAIGPNIKVIVCPNTAVGLPNLTLPSITALATYLRTTFPGLYRPGLSWEIDFINNSGSVVIALGNQVPAVGQTLTVYGEAGGTGTGLGIESTTRVRWLFADTTLGAEHLYMFYMS